MIDVDQERAERLAVFHGGGLGLAQEFVQRPPVREAGQRIGPRAFLGFGERVADGIELALLLLETGLELRRAGRRLVELVDQALDHDLRIGAGVGLVGHIADRSHMAAVVVDRGRKELPRRFHHGVELLRDLVGDGLVGGFRTDIVRVQALIGGGVKLSLVADHDIDRPLQHGRLAEPVVEPDVKIYGASAAPAALPSTAGPFPRSTSHTRNRAVRTTQPW